MSSRHAATRGVVMAALAVLVVVTAVATWATGTDSARQLADSFQTTVPTVAYEVRLGRDGQALEWIEHKPSGEVRHDTEPETGWFLRGKVNLLSVLPIDWLL